MIFAHLYLLLILLDLLSLDGNAILLGLGLAHLRGHLLHPRHFNLDGLALGLVLGLAHLQGDRCICSCIHS